MLINEFKDSFSGSSLDASKWPTTYGPHTVADGRLSIITTSAYSGIESSYFDARDGSVFAEIEIPSYSGGGREFYIELLSVLNTDDRLSFFWSGGSSTLYMRRRQGGGTTTESVPYDPVQMRFLRIRNEGDVNYWDSSPDGVTWTTRRTSGGSTLDLSTTTLVILAGDWEGTFASPMHVYGVNVAPAAFSSFKHWDGTTWLNGPPKIATAGGWVIPTARRWDGSVWVPAPDVPNPVQPAEPSSPPEYVEVPGVPVTTFQAGHGWTASGQLGTANLDDTENAIQGTQCATVTSNGAQGGGMNLQLLTDLNLDLTNKALRILVKVHNPEALKELNLLVGSNNTFSNSMKWMTTVKTGISGFYQEQEWTEVVLNFANLHSGAGSYLLPASRIPPSMTATKMRFQIIDNGSPVTVSVQAVEVIDDMSVEYPNGVASIDFDDSFISQYELAFPALQARGMAGTMYVIAENVGKPGYVTLEHLHEMQDAGWDIAAHSYSKAMHDARMTSFTAAEVEADMAMLKGWLEHHGFTGQTYAYPGGAYEKTTDGFSVEEIVAKYFISGRTVLTAYGSATNSLAEVVPPPRPWRMYGQSAINDQTTGMDNVTNLLSEGGELDTTASLGAWPQLTFHVITEGTPSSVDEIAITDLERLLDGLISRGIPVKTTGEVLWHHLKENQPVEYIEPVSEPITTFQAGHGWTLAGAGSTYDPNNTEQFIIGSQSAKVTVTSGSGLLKRVGMPAFDLTDKALRVRMKMRNYQKMNNIQVRIGTSNLASAFRFRANPRNTATQAFGVDDEWFTFTLSWADVYDTQGAGAYSLDSRRSPNITSGFTDMEIILGTGGGGGPGPVEFWVQSVDIVPNTKPQYPNGVVSIGWDDGFASSWDGFQLMESFEMVGTHYLIASNVGTAGRLTLPQYQSMQAAGWEIAGHSFTQAAHDARWITLTADQVHQEAYGLAEWLHNNGFEGTSFAYPGGEFAETTDGVIVGDIVKEYFTNGRSILFSTGVANHFISDVLPPAMPWRIRCISGIAESKPTTSADNPSFIVSEGGVLDRVQDAGAYLNLLFHETTSGVSTNGMYVGMAALESILQGIEDRGMTVLPAQDVLAPLIL